MLKTLLTALTAIVVLAGVLLTGIVASSALELTGGGAVAPPDPVIIVSVLCVEDLGASGFNAHFEYENTTGAVVNIPAGINNGYRVDGGKRGAPNTSFAPGAGNHGFDVVAQNFVTWTVTDANGHETTATATVEDTPCVDETTTTVADTSTSTSTTVAPTTTTIAWIPTTTSTSTTVAPTTTSTSTSTTEAPTTTTVPPTTTTCEPYVCKS